MLGKLMKYEIKATARYFLPLYAAIIVLSFFIGIRTYEGPFYSLLNGILPTALVLSFVGLAIITMILVVTRFDKNLLSDEGYLMFTLPVKTTSLINSKLFTSLIWIFSSFLVFILSIFLIGWRYFEVEFFKESFRVIFSEPFFLIILVLLLVMSIVNFLLQVYASLGVAQAYSVTKSRILGGTIIFVGIATFFNIIESVVAFLGALLFRDNQWIQDMVLQMESNYFGDILPSLRILLTVVLLYTILKNILFYVLTKYHLNKKLNLE